MIPVKEWHGLSNHTFLTPANIESYPIGIVEMLIAWSQNALTSGHMHASIFINETNLLVHKYFYSLEVQILPNAHTKRSEH